MKTIIRSLLYISILMFGFILCSSINSYAATTSLSASPKEPTQGQKVTVTAEVTAGAWNLELSGAGKTETIYGFTNSNSNASAKKSITFTAGAAGTKYTFTLKGDMTDISDEHQDVNKSITITIKSNNTGGSSGGNTSSGGNSSSGGTTTTPKFTSVNQTVYCTEDDVNVRSSYSTSSSALGQLDKGDSVTRTGIATVNGRAWSRIKYNGKTAYVVSQYLSTTKPTITTETNNENEIEEETTEEKSDNSFLKSLVVTPEGLEPAFDKNETEYKLTVGSDIDTLKVDAVADHEKAKVSISGNEDLEIGKNTVTIKVTAEDGSTKTYTIVVTKEKKEQLALKELLIEGLPLTPEFDMTTYKYTLNLENSEVKELNITATATREDAEVEIIGNTELKIGENTITILVTDGDETATYQISVTLPEPPKKELSDYIAEFFSNKLYLFVALGVVLLIVIIIIIILVRRNKNDEDDSLEENNILEDISFGNKVEETKIAMEKLSDDELPKSLRKNKEEEKIELKSDEKEETINNERNEKIDELLSNPDEYEENTSKRKKGKHF